MTRLLFDTHLLLWAASDSPFLPKDARAMLLDADSTVFFSAASIHEIAIKRRLNRPDFLVEPDTLRQGLMVAGYGELSISARHAAYVRDMPDIHKDPFDRLLIAQAAIEGMRLVTSDAIVGRYDTDILFLPKPAAA